MVLHFEFDGRVAVGGRFMVLNFAPPFTKCFTYVIYVMLTPVLIPVSHQCAVRETPIHGHVLCPHLIPRVILKQRWAGKIFT